MKKITRPTYDTHHVYVPDNPCYDSDPLGRGTTTSYPLLPRVQSGLRGRQEESMMRNTADRSVLLTVSVLFLCAALASAQSGKRRQQEPRGVPATAPAASPERRVALVIGNAAYQYT